MVVGLGREVVVLGAFVVGDVGGGGGNPKNGGGVVVVVVDRRLGFVVVVVTSGAPNPNQMTAGSVDVVAVGAGPVVARVSDERVTWTPRTSALASGASLRNFQTPAAISARTTTSRRLFSSCSSGL